MTRRTGPLARPTCDDCGNPLSVARPGGDTEAWYCDVVGCRMCVRELPTATDVRERATADERAPAEEDARIVPNRIPQTIATAVGFTMPRGSAARAGWEREAAKEIVKRCGVVDSEIALTAVKVLGERLADWQVLSASDLARIGSAIAAEAEHARRLEDEAREERGAS